MAELAEAAVPLREELTVEREGGRELLAARDVADDHRHAHELQRRVRIRVG